jgi:putative hydrolase of the HAD superfamily
VPPSEHNRHEARGVILDLDDTLYPEHDYFLSGTHAVIRFLTARLEIPEDVLRQELQALLAEPAGRCELFDRLLRRLSVWSAELAATLVHIYRTHRPQLNPCPDVLPALRRFKQSGYRLGLVSDGPATVQRIKFESLGVSGFFDALVFTDDLPAGCRKPSTVPFRVAAELLGVDPSNCAYIADDPAKDFLGPRELGMLTICIKRPLSHPLRSSHAFPASHEADEIFESLDEVKAQFTFQPPSTLEPSP